MGSICCRRCPCTSECASPGPAGVQRLFRQLCGLRVLIYHFSDTKVMNTYSSQSNRKHKKMNTSLSASRSPASQENHILFPDGLFSLRVYWHAQPQVEITLGGWFSWIHGWFSWITLLLMDILPSHTLRSSKAGFSVVAWCFLTQSF